MFFSFMGILSSKVAPCTSGIEPRAFGLLYGPAYWRERGGLLETLGMWVLSRLAQLSWEPNLSPKTKP